MMRIDFMAFYEPDIIEEDEDEALIVFNDESELEDVQSFGISGNVSSPAISSHMSSNSSSPMNSGMLGNSSSPAVLQNLSDNISSPAVLNDYNEGPDTLREFDEYGVLEYGEATVPLVEENTGFEEAGPFYYEETEEQIGEIRMGRNEDEEWVLQAIKVPDTDLGREEADRFVDSIIKQLEGAAA